MFVYFMHFIILHSETNDDRKPIKLFTDCYTSSIVLINFAKTLF